MFDSLSSMATTDLELLHAWRGGDRGAGQALVRRYYGPVLRFFELRSRNPEDLTQTTLLACVESKERFRGDASFRTFVFAIARQQLVQALSEHHHAQRMSRFDTPSSTPKTSLSALFARKQEQHVVLVALASLPEDVQTLVVLHYWEQLRSREIAEIMDIPTSTVTTRLSRARQALAANVRTMASERVRVTVLGDIDGWTRSLATEEGLRSIPDAVIDRVAALLTRR